MPPATPDRDRDRHGPRTLRRDAHRSSYSISSLLSYFTGSEVDGNSSPIRVVRRGPASASASQAHGRHLDSSPETGSPVRERLSEARYPALSSFTFASLAAGVDGAELQRAFQQAVESNRSEFAGCVDALSRRQARLLQRVAEADALSRQTLQTVRRRTRAAEREAVSLSNCSTKLAELCDATYHDIDRIVKLFAAIDSALPADERIGIAATHYDKLAPLISTQTPAPTRSRPRKTKATTTAAPSSAPSPAPEEERVQVDDADAGAEPEPEPDAAMADADQEGGQSISSPAATTPELASASKVDSAKDATMTEAPANESETVETPQLDDIAEEPSNAPEVSTDTAPEHPAPATEEAARPRARRKPSHASIRAPNLRTRVLPPMPNGASSQRVTSKGSIVSTFDEGPSQTGRPAGAEVVVADPTDPAFLALPRHERDRLSTRTSMKSRAGGRSIFSTVSRAGRRWWSGRPLADDDDEDDEQDDRRAAALAEDARSRRVTRVGDLTGTDARDRLRKISGHDATAPARQ